MTSAIIMANFSNLGETNFEAPFSVWAHVDRSVVANDRDHIRSMVESGCRYFLLTGENGLHFEEVVDEVVEDFSNDLILTSSSNQTFEECAAEFMSIDSVQGKRIASRVIFVINDDSQKKDKAISEIIDGLCAAGLDTVSVASIP